MELDVNTTAVPAQTIVGPLANAVGVGGVVQGGETIETRDREALGAAPWDATAKENSNTPSTTVR